MITKFDKGAKAEYFKEQFAECIDDCAYEDAFDFLLKYADEKHNADFHMACGMLYLQMTQDSDDTELYALALREFLMHIRRFPKCEAAYKYILAVLFLRGNFPQAVTACKWISRRGINLKRIVDELAEAGILFISPSAPADIDGMFGCGDYGEIDPEPCEPQDGDVPCELSYKDMLDGDGRESAAREEYGSEEQKLAQACEMFLNGERPNIPSKIIKFERPDRAERTEKKSGKTEITRIAAETPQNETVSDFRRELEKLLSEELDGRDDEPEHVLETNVLEELHKRIVRDLVFRASDDYNDKHYGGSDDGAPDYADEYADDFVIDGRVDVGDIVQRMTLGNCKAIDAALYYLDGGKYDQARELLESINGDDENYSKALVLRALIELDQNNDDVAAEKLLKSAHSIDKTDPIAGLALCDIYEDRGQKRNIAQILKRMELHDFASVKHVYKVARLAEQYCGRDDCMDILGELIDEYNILSLRLVYAQMLYNDGDRDEALDELYILSRLYYDDLNTQLLYEMAKSNVRYMPETTDALPESITKIVEDLMAYTLGGKLEMLKGSDRLEIVVKFFVGLSYSQPKALLKKMFDTLRVLTLNDNTREAVLDAMTDPYVEPLVKAVVLSARLECDPSEKFLFESGYLPVSDECVRPIANARLGYIRAYAYITVLCRSGLDKFFELKRKLENGGEDGAFSDAEIAYFLVRSVMKNQGVKLDGRIETALGVPSKSEAARAFRELGAVISKS